MQVVEKFVSINGEGMRVGELSVFIRFRGCNLMCSYCDTTWANEPFVDYTEETPEEIFRYIKGTGIKNVTITGGEPLLQKDVDRFIGLILSGGDYRVEVETNGSVDISRFENSPAVVTMDYKLPSSGFEESMLTENFEHLKKEDSVKFVAGSLVDLECALDIINEYNLTEKCNVIISPVFGMIKPENIVEFMKRNKLNDVRLQLQMHKTIWDPNLRGV